MQCFELQVDLERKISADTTAAGSSGSVGSSSSSNGGSLALCLCRMGQVCMLRRGNRNREDDNGGNRVGGDARAPRPGPAIRPPYVMTRHLEVGAQYFEAALASAQDHQRYLQGEGDAGSGSSSTTAIAGDEHYCGSNGGANAGSGGTSAMATMRDLEAFILHHLGEIYAQVRAQIQIQIQVQIQMQIQVQVQVQLRV